MDEELIHPEHDLEATETAQAEAMKAFEAKQEEEKARAQASGTPEDDMGFLPDNPAQLVSETGKALWGGVTDAVESVGGFSRRLYDTSRWGIHKAYGLPMQDEENIFNKNYKVQNPLEIPDNWEPENKSGLGKLTRGIAEFVALTWATGGTGAVSGIGKLAKTPKYWKAMHHASRNKSFMQAVAKAKARTPWQLRLAPLAGTKIGARTLSFIPKGTKIAAEGAIADLISESSEQGNMANLVAEYAPWMPFAEALAVDPDRDNPWMARIKTVLAGSGFNLGGWLILGFARGRWAAIRARSSGKSVAESNIIGTNTFKQTVSDGLQKDADASASMKQFEIENNQGISSEPYEDYLKRHLPEDEYDALQVLRQGNLLSSRGNPVYFHGAPFKEGKLPKGYKPKTAKEASILPGSQDLNIDKTFQSNNQYIWSDENLYGDGLYVSDDISIASKERLRKATGQGYVYKLNEAGENRIVYQVDETTGPMKQDGTRGNRGGPVNLLDGDAKMKWNSRTPIANIFRKVVFDASDFPKDLYGKYGEKEIWERYWPKGEEMSYVDLIEKIKEQQLFPREDVIGIIEQINEKLGEMGYGGLKYKGQVDSVKGIKEHDVRVYWYPEDQITLSKVDVDGRIADSVQELEDLAKANGAAKGDVWVDEVKSSTNQLENGNSSPTPFRNPNKFDASEKATIPVDSDLKNNTKNLLRETIKNYTSGNREVGTSQLFLESQIKRMAAGNKDLAEYIREVAEELTLEIFENPRNTMDFRQVQESMLNQAEELYKIIDGGGDDYAARLKQAFVDNSDNKIIWIHDGAEVVTGNAATKIALELIIHSMVKRAQLIAQGSFELPKGVSLIRQFDQVADTLKVAMTEYKKISYMTGNELAQQNFGNRLLSPLIKKELEQGLALIAKRESEFHEELARLVKSGDRQQRADLMELYFLSDGKVRTMEHIHEWFKSKMIGGRMDGDAIKGQYRNELRGAYYNSILSGPKTPVKAVAGTSFIATLRPFQAWLGGALGGSKRTQILAAAQIDSIGQAYAEGLQMFKRNWDLGVNRKQQDYFTKFSFENDIAEWKKMGEFIKRYGTDGEKNGYFFIDKFVDANQSPWMKYSQNMMGAGDSLARTVVGRMHQRLEAATAILDSKLVDLDDVRATANAMEEEFRKNIFKKNKDEVWIVSDKAAKLAGDEAALTKALTGWSTALEGLRKLPGGRMFFPFIKTGYNALELAFGHSFFVRLQSRWQDVMKGDPATLLQKYGIKPEHIEYEQALLRGREAMGNMMMGVASIAAMTGMMYGDLPHDAETRDLWKMNGIKPNSFKIGNVYISFQDIEPFNTLLSMTANLFNYQHVLGEKGLEKWYNQITFMWSSTIIDKSMLASVADLGQILNTRPGNEKQIQRILAKFARPQIAPWSGASAFLANLTDANEKAASNFFEYVARREFVFKSMLAPKYDILSKDRSGKKYYPPPENPMMRTFNALSPIAITWADGDPVKMGLREMSFDIPEVLSTYKGVRLSNFELAEVQKYMSMGTLRNRLENLMRPNGVWRRDLDTYKRLNLNNKEDKIFEQRFYQDVHKIFVDEKKKAMARVLAENPKLAASIQARLDRKAYGQSGKYDKIETLINMPK